MLDEYNLDGLDDPLDLSGAPSDVIETTQAPQIPTNAASSDNQPMDGTFTDIFSAPDFQPPDEDMPFDLLGNSPPMVLFGMGDVNASIDTYMEYEIPNSVFYDVEDNMSYDMEMEVGSQMCIEFEGTATLFP